MVSMVQNGRNYIIYLLSYNKTIVDICFPRHEEALYFHSGKCQLLFASAEYIHMHFREECGGSVVTCFTQGQGVAVLSLIGGTALRPLSSA